MTQAVAECWQRSSCIRSASDSEHLKKSPAEMDNCMHVGKADDSSCGKYRPTERSLKAEDCKGCEPRTLCRSDGKDKDADELLKTSFSLGREMDTSTVQDSDLLALHLVRNNKRTDHQN